MNPFCRVFGHHRSVRHAKMNFEAHRWESVCTICGAPMIRVSHHNWHVVN